jgi:hypothetical protein
MQLGENDSLQSNRGFANPVGESLASGSREAKHKAGFRKFPLWDMLDKATAPHLLLRLDVKRHGQLPTGTATSFPGPHPSSLLRPQSCIPSLVDTPAAEMSVCTQTPAATDTRSPHEH